MANRATTQPILADIFDIHQLIQDVNDGYIRESYDCDDPDHHILCYTPITQFQRHWNTVTRACRGLTARYHGNIADGTTSLLDLGRAPVTSRGIPKFFTVDAIANAPADNDNVILSLEDDDEMVTQLQGITVSGSTRVHVADKIDGAMCVAYVNNEGELRFHTKGSFASNEGAIANRIITSEHTSDTLRKLGALITHTPYTPIFEVVTPQYLHVVNYEGLEALFYLGAVNNATGEWISAGDDHETPYPDVFHDLGIKSPEVFEAPTLQEALSLPSRANREGVVVTVYSSPQRMLKVKYEAFLALQKLKHETTSSIVEVVQQLLAQDIKTIDELAALDKQHLMTICGIPTDAEPDVDFDMMVRIAELVATNALIIADRYRDEVEEEFTFLNDLWEKVDDICAKTYITNKNKQDIYIAQVLDWVPVQMRPQSFASKKLYLADERAALRDFVARAVVKRHRAEIKQGLTPI